VSHFTYTLFFATLLSAAQALPGERGIRERLSVTGYTFLCFALALVAGSWGMYWIHG